jgi:uncharacterized membrane protein (DUF2068 family)
MLSGLLYLPWEIHALVRHNRVMNWLILITNIAIVLYMVYLRTEEVRRRHAAPTHMLD